MKCDCGELDKPHHPREKCIHLREAEERAKAGLHDDHPAERDPAHLASVAEEQGCCCLHGGKCSCAVLKKENGDAAAPHGPAVKPRLEKTTSEGAITVFSNGHHKPVHRKNHAAHENGMPYKLPMARLHTDHGVGSAARRSVDSLALDSHMPQQPSSFNPQTSAPFNTGRRKSKSEQPSPKLQATPRSELTDPKLKPIDSSTLAQTQTNQSTQSSTSDTFNFPAFDPMSGVMDNSYDPWSAYPSADSLSLPNNNPFGVWPTQNDVANIGQPALTAASSGTQSEIDEVPSMDDVYGLAMPSIQEDVSDATRGTENSPQTNRRSLPPGFFGNVDFGMGNFNTNDWQTAVGGFNKSRVPQNTSTINFSDPWQVSTMPQFSNAQRALGALSDISRPQSRSVGPGSTPNDELIRQLFPDMDMNNFLANAGSPQALSGDKVMGRTAAPTSAPMNFGSVDNNTVDFTSQTWSDGSINVPNDSYTPPYDLDQDYSSPDFPAAWSQ